MALDSVRFCFSFFRNSLTPHPSFAFAALAWLASGCWRRQQWHDASFVRCRQCMALDVAAAASGSTEAAPCGSLCCAGWFCASWIDFLSQIFSCELGTFKQRLASALMLSTVLAVEAATISTSGNHELTRGASKRRLAASAVQWRHIFSFVFCERRISLFTQSFRKDLLQLSSLAALAWLASGCWQRHQRLGACWQRVPVDVAAAAAGGSAEAALVCISFFVFSKQFLSHRSFAALAWLASGCWRRQQWLDACRRCMALNVAAAASGSAEAAMLHCAVACALLAGHFGFAAVWFFLRLWAL